MALNILTAFYINAFLEAVAHAPAVGEAARKKPPGLGPEPVRRRLAPADPPAAENYVATSRNLDSDVLVRQMLKLDAIENGAVLEAVATALNLGVRVLAGAATIHFQNVLFVELCDEYASVGEITAEMDGLLRATLDRPHAAAAAAALASEDARKRRMEVVHRRGSMRTLGRELDATAADDDRAAVAEATWPHPRAAESVLYRRRRLTVKCTLAQQEPLCRVYLVRQVEE